MGVSIVIDLPGAPQSGQEVIVATDPTDRGDFQAKAATAASSHGGFLSVTKADGEVLLVNLDKVRSVV